jgi:DNA-binding LacI/PurR family transcriptional regulator
MIYPDSRMLKYKRAEHQVRKLISNSRIGDKLPTERELAKMLGCNVLTVRKGMQILVDEGYLSRRVGSGTFVINIPAIEEFSGRPGVEHIGIVSHSDGGFYSFQVVQAIASAALEQNIELRSFWTRDYGESLMSTVRDMARSGCKSLIIPWFPPSKIDAVRRFAHESPIQPVLPQRLPGLEHLCFEEPGIFGKSAGLEVDVLYDYFIRLGSERIHFIGPSNTESPAFQEKITSFIRSAANAGREPVFGLFDHSTEKVLALARKYKEFAGNLAIISYDDAHAVRFMTAMHKLSLTAPVDFRIVGHNDSSAARNTEPPLSTIRENFEYIGGAMLQCAHALAQGKHVQSSRSPNPRLLVRESCGGREKAATFNIRNMDIEIISPTESEPVAGPVLA